MQAVTIKQMIEPIRKKQTRYGTEKLYLDLVPQLKQSNIKMGRDKFFTFCRQHHLLVPRTKQSLVIINSRHFFFRPPNLGGTLYPRKRSRFF